MNIKNKKLRGLVFFAYTLGIYLFPTFVGAMVMYAYGTARDALRHLVYAENIFFAPIFLPMVTLKHAFPDKPEKLLIFVLEIIAMCLYAVPFIFWWRKQTLIRGGIIALMGFVAGPGSVFFIYALSPA